MALYLDTEFNGFGGELISIALHNTEGPGYYEVVEEKLAYPKQWVIENVMPVLNKPPRSKHYIKWTVRNYLIEHALQTIIYADWAEDFKHLLDQTFENEGKKYIGMLTMRLITVPDIHVSKIPHNALEDAKALYLNHMEMKSGPTIGVP